MVAEGREQEPSALCSQDALFVIPSTALRPSTKMVRGRFADDMNGRVKSRFVAAEVARDARHDGRKASSAQHGALRHRGRIRARESCSLPGPAGERRVLLAVEGALWYSNGFKTVAATLFESAQDARVEFEQSDAWFLPPPRPCWNVRVSQRRFHGRRQ